MNANPHAYHRALLRADYRVANARIHVIDGVLGELPESARDE